MSCECFQIGGPFIAEDPDCPAHGQFGLRHELENLEIQIDTLRAALTIFADAASWRMNGSCDPNGSRFIGQALAQAALDVK